MKKTLGGDRLGSGNNMKVELHNYERSTHDLGYVFRTTMSSGTLVPFLKEIALPGDSFDINLNCDVKTHPTVGPLFGSYKVQIDIFQCPIRLYIRSLHNNKIGIGMRMQDVFLPQLIMTAPSTSTLTTLEEYNDLDNSQINPSCIFSYLGIRGVGVNRVSAVAVERNMNAIPYLAYWDIYKNYYSNKQEEIGAMVHQDPTNVVTNVDVIDVDGQPLANFFGGTPRLLIVGHTITVTRLAAGPQPPEDIVLNLSFGLRPTLAEAAQFASTAGLIDTYIITSAFDNQYAYNWSYATGTSVPKRPIEIVTFPLENIDTMREDILAAPTTTPYLISQASNSPYGLPFNISSDNQILSKQFNQEGLALKTYQSDLLNNWLSTEWIDGTNGISEITAVDTTGGSFTMDTLALAKKVYDMLNRIAVSGGTYDDWQDAVWTHERHTKAETPIYHGGLIKELVFQEVVSNSQSTGGEGQGAEPLGTLAGKGVMGHKHKGGEVTIRIDEPSYIIGIVSITPRLDYSQGNDWDIHLESMDDLHKPALDEIGFQELITEQMTWWDTAYNGTNWVTKSAGKQPAWINYMTNINRVRGNFANEEENFMVLNRRYTPELVGGAIGIQDLTTYVDPRIFNQIFADTSLDSQNYWTQIGVDMTVRRKISAKLIPNV